MSILSGFKKFKDYILTDSGYQLSSRWTKSDAVVMGDGTDDTNTLEKNLGSINGITDSLTATNSKVALSSAAGKSLQDQITSVNSQLGTKVANDSYGVHGIGLSYGDDGSLNMNVDATTFKLAKTTDLPPDFKLFRNFTSSDDGLAWSIQIGQPVMGTDVDTCCFGFRKNCPVDGQLSLVIDGRIYQNEGQCMCLDTQNYSNYAAPTNHKQAYTADELVTYTSDENTMGVTPAGVRKAINGRFSLSGTTLYINTL